MTRTMPIVGALVLTACAAPRWSHRTKTAEDFRIDKAQCHAHAFQGYGSQTNVFIAVDVMKSCMVGKGWYEIEAPPPPVEAASMEGLRR